MAVNSSHSTHLGGKAWPHFTFFVPKIQDQCGWGMSVDHEDPLCAALASGQMLPKGSRVSKLSQKTLTKESRATKLSPELFVLTMEPQMTQ